MVKDREKVAQIDANPTRVEDINTLLSPIDRSSRQK
jgi:hypothetical protein